MKVYRVVASLLTFTGEERDEFFFLSKDKALEKLQNLLPKDKRFLKEIYEGYPIIKCFTDGNVDDFYVEEIDIEE